MKSTLISSIEVESWLIFFPIRHRSAAIIVISSYLNLRVSSNTLTGTIAFTVLSLYIVLDIILDSW